MRTLVITPTYVEAENIDEFLRRTRAALPSADILVVDDNSPDGTADIAEAAAAELGGIDVLRRPVKQGLGSAYRAGFAIGLEKGYEALVQIDADLSHDPACSPTCSARSSPGPTSPSARDTCPGARSRTGRGSGGRWTSAAPC